MKTCTKCKSILKESNFHKNSFAKDGLNYRCKKCENKRVKQYRKNNIEKVLLKKRLAHKSIHGRFMSIKYGAKQRNIQFNLSEKEFKKTFWNKNCYYCNNKIDGVGIDRKDNSIGYLLDNCVPCCITCNMMKKTLHYKEFIKQCKLIALTN